MGGGLRGSSRGLGGCKMAEGKLRALEKARRAIVGAWLSWRGCVEMGGIDGCA